MTRIMIIGGTDSSGGAGLSRDTAVAAALGYEVMPIVTAVTAQSDVQFMGAHPVPPEFVAMQIKAALAQGLPAAIKIGMLGSHDVALAVADALAGLHCPVVLDPVMKSTSGGVLMAGGLPQSLLSQTRLITPNLEEAATLSGTPQAKTDAALAAQANWFLAQGAQAVLIKGGHGAGQASVDHLFDGADHHPLQASRLAKGRRGTGCALATAIACQLAGGDDLRSACQAAKMYIHAWIGESQG